MPDIFNWEKIKKLIDEEHPSVAIMIDSNIIVNEPDFAKWKTPFDKPLYILPCMVQSELEHLKNRPESKGVACAAAQNISHLCREGNILGGIFKKEVGWFVSTPLPERGALESELERLDSLVKAFGQMDTKLIIMAREFSRLLPSIPLVFVTKDKSLFNTLQFIGINSYLYQGFPLTGIDKLVKVNTADSTKWDQVLQDIQVEAEKKLVHVDLTLVSKGSPPGWIRMLNGDEFDDIVVAEGTGVIHGLNDIFFTWALPYIPWDFPSQEEDLAEEDDASGEDNQEEKKPGKLSLGNAFLDFGDLEHTVSPGLYAALVKKMNNCASPMAYIEDMPTLQDPISVMRQFFLFEYVFQERNQNELPRESLEELEKKLSEENNLFNWGYYWLRDREAPKQDIDISLSEFLHAIRSCWSIGETIEIELMDNPAELTNLKGEAEE